VRSVEQSGDDEYVIVSDHRPTSVRLGTQYPARLIALNPPAPVGQLQATDAPVNVTLENANVENRESYDGDPVTLLDEFESSGFETRFLRYQPNYNEYREAPETTLEHSLLYNEFQNTDLVVKDQRLIDGTRLRVVLFSGSVPQPSDQTVSLDPATMDGPTAPINVTADPGENLNLTIPTRSPQVWESEDVIGATFDEGATHARVIDNGTQQVTIQLEAGETYQLRAARVGFDGSSNGPERFTPIQVSEGAAGGGGGGGGAPPAYDISWDPASMDGEPAFECTADRCEIATGESGSVAIRTADQIGGFAEFAVADTTIGTFTSYSSAFENGGLLDTVEFTAGNTLGETSVFVFAGDGRDELTIEVTGLAVQITGTNSPVTEGETLDITADVENTGSTSVTRTLELLIEGEGVVASQEVTVAPGATESRTLSWTSEAGDAGDYTATISSGDDTDTTNVTVLAAEAPEFTSITVDSAGQGQRNNELTFTYETTSDATGVTLFAISSDNTELVNDSTAPTDTTGVTYTFDDIQMNQQNIDIEMTVRDGNGNSRTCTGTITTQGGSTSLADMTCSVN
jgi:hypothetical protein